MSVDDAGGSGNYDEYKTIAATGTGTTRTYSLKIPYAWSLSSQTNDFMYSGYSVVATAGTASALPQRTASVDVFDGRNVPPNGAITNLTAAVTL
jgi:hypothetical protein